MSVDWSYYDKPIFDELNDKYLPIRGEGDNMAMQAVTAANKLVYKWYNDGDVYDNTWYLEGWVNDLSSYANWLYKYTKVSQILDTISYCKNDSDYEDLLKKVADEIFDHEYLAELEKKSKVGSIYDCAGPFEFSKYREEDDDGYWEYEEEETFEDEDEDY